MAQGSQLFVDPEFDTDLFGTFCGEIPRKEGPKTTVKEKCLAGMKKRDVLQGLASEGSFGPHPSIPFLKMNEEWIVYIDLEKDLEIYGHSIGLEVCHEQLHHKDADRLSHFLFQIDFGAQGLQLKDANTNKIIEKGITSHSVLNDLLQRYPDWVLETDLRAHLNPKRQAQIVAAAQNLIARSQSLCPKCQAPDFWIQDHIGQLPCCHCGHKTNTHASLKYGCHACDYEQIEARKDLLCVDPEFCPYCNP